MKRTRLELVGGGSRKFWEVSVQGKSVTVSFGRLGTAGRSQSTTFASDAAASAKAARLIEEKTRKGYRAVTSERQAVGSTDAVAKMRARLQELVPACFEADRALHLLETGDPSLYAGPIARFYGKPCRPEDIAALEKRLEVKLPPSYRAYLSLYGSKRNDDFPLGAKQHASKETKEALDDMDGLFEESRRGNPIAKGAIPFLLSADLGQMILLVPPARADGEMAVVDYDNTEEVCRFRDLVAYFEAELAETKALVAELSDKARRKPAKAKQAPAKTSKAPKPAPKQPDAEPSMKQAIDIVLAGKRGARLELAMRVMHAESISDLYEALSAAKVPRFVRALRALPEAALVAERLGYEAAQALVVKKERAKARPLVELILDSVPKTPLKRGTKNSLSSLNGAIYYANKAKERVLANVLAEAARPHAGAHDNLPHNAACAFAAVGRYDEALAMCRIAVQNGYHDLARMKVDRDLGPLLKSPDFQALFAKGAKTKPAKRATAR